MYRVSETAANRMEFLHSKHAHTKEMHSIVVSLKTMHKRKQYKEHPIASSFMHAVQVDGINEMSKRSPGYFSVPRFAVAFLAGALEIGGVAPCRVSAQGTSWNFGGEATGI